MNAAVSTVAELDAEGGPIRVLLIEDDLVDEMATLRIVTQEALPYRMQVVRSIADARRVLETECFDVILADYKLKDGTSFDLMDTFGEQMVIFITGAWDPAAAAQALRLGVHDYLIKDDEGRYLKLLRYRVETALRQRRLARQLRESEAFLQAILDNAPTSISAHDLSGQLILSNRHHAQHACHTEDHVPPMLPQHAPLECEETRTDADGSQRTYLTVRFALPQVHGRGPSVGTISVDITARKQAEEQIRNLAFYDPLTLLPNRRMLVDRLQQAFSSSARSRRHGAVFFIDLDHFKTLNDTLGHDHGDLLLQEVARRLVASVRGEDTVARIGGDEFVVMVVNLASTTRAAAAQAAVVGEKILKAVSLPCMLKSHLHRVTPSVGVSLFSGRDLAVDEVVKRADQAMYQAKAAGRGTVRFFDPEMQAAQETRTALEHDLRSALEKGELCLHYQGQIDQHRGAVGAQAVLRWQHPQRGLLMPADFVPLAEENGLIVPIGEWVITRACAQLRAWADHALTRHLRLAVNVSARQFRDDGFVEHLTQALRTHGAEPARLRLELRESVVQENPERTLARMQALKAIGVQLAMDEFGINFCSLSHLKRLPLDQVKIARALIPTMVSDPHDAAIVKTIIGIAGGMGLAALAAGVETAQQRDLLRAMGCSQWQGRYFGEPEPLDGFESLLKSDRYAGEELHAHS
jgi:diguanylate cyclase (GGDEF)-like protein